VVISAAVCSKAGRPLVARQFVEISRSRIEGLLSAFPKLMDVDSEHTFVETENVRYLYHPLESVYMLIITNKSSNIIEDLDTLHLMAKLVPIYCGSLDERSIIKNAYELVFALDEVISAGQKEKVSVSRIKTLTEMDSHEEKIHDIVERNKQRGATETGRAKMKEIEAQKKMGRAASGGMGYNSGGSGSGSYSREPAAIPQRQEASSPYSSSKKTTNRPAAKKGMQLKAKSSQSNEYLKALQDIGEISDDPISTNDDYGDSVAVEQVNKKDVHVEIEETVSVVLTQDSALESMELKGELRVEILNPAFSHVLLALAKPNKKFQFRTHPNINKMRFNKDSSIALKDTSKAFPLRTPLGVLKWRFTSNDETDLPLSVTCWPTPGNEMVTVNLEYELLQEHLDLQNVEIAVPIPQGHTPVVEQADGSYDFDSVSGNLVWKMPVIDKDSSNGSMEFVLPFSGSTSSFFPVDVRFASVTPYSGVTVNSVNKIEDNSPIDYSSHIHLTSNRGDYQVQFQ